MKDKMQTERLILRKFNLNDANSLFFYAKDNDVGPVAGWKAHKSVEDSRRIIETVLSIDETYAICDKTTNKAIGSISFYFSDHSSVKLGENEAEIGFWIGKPYWGQGLMPEAARALMEYGFNELGLTKIWCGYFEGNEKSKRVQEKLGFKYQYTLKDIYWDLMDDIRTEHVNAITREEFLR